jgi:trehalose 6-phosphate synthase/phosphatase
MEYPLPNKRLLLVSNRLPFQLLEKNAKITLKESDGGLVSALKSFTERNDADTTFHEKWWIGSADFPQARWEKFIAKNKSSQGFEIAPIFIEPRTYNRYYNGFCNATLWPLFHYFPSFVEYDEQTFRAYEEVNHIFAERLAEIIKPGDVIWVHDYQLFLLPEMIRERFPDVTIGFFLHIPFPNFEVFRILHRPWKEKIVKGLLGADLIGFHTSEYVQHFLKTVRMVLGFDHEYRTVFTGSRLVKADLFPLGIDFEKFQNAGKLPAVIEQKEQIGKNFQGKRIIFSVDRLDYTKGVTHRLAGFERFLELHPEWREKVVFIMVVVPSRQIISKYNERRKLIEEQVGRINGKHSSLQWQPVIYRYSHLAFEELCALYQASDVALITPLRDGMNLVAKEYAASRIEQDGVLILSELAGASSEMGESILVNPFDKEEMAQAIFTALNMPLADQRTNMVQLQKRLVDYDVMNWVNDFLRQLDEVKQFQQSQETKFVTRAVQEHLLHDFQTASCRHLFLDYDGTLVPFARNPRIAVPDRGLLRLLSQLTANTKNEITLISGRDSGTLQEWFKNLSINIVAEHGASLRLRNGEWQQAIGLNQSWKPLIRPTLELFSQRSPGSFVEEKAHTLAWHYRNVDPELGFIRSRELLDNLFHLVRNGQLQVIDGNKVIEVRIAGVDKGTAAKKLLEDRSYDFVLAIGDDKTDEDMFKALAERAVTVKVGGGHTAAQYNIPSQQQVIQLLNKLTVIE